MGTARRQGFIHSISTTETSQTHQTPPKAQFSRLNEEKQPHLPKKIYSRRLNHELYIGGFEGVVEDSNNLVLMSDIFHLLRPTVDDPQSVKRRTQRRRKGGKRKKQSFYIGEATRTKLEKRVERGTISRPKAGNSVGLAPCLLFFRKLGNPLSDLPSSSHLTNRGRLRFPLPPGTVGVNTQYHHPPVLSSVRNRPRII